MNTFNRDLQRGKIGERIVIDALRKKYLVDDVTDFDKHKHDQLNGIDLYFYANDKKYSADVKYNLTDQNNTYLEIEMKSGRKGWFETSKADVIFVCGKYSKQIYYYHLNKMRDYINQALKNGEKEIKETSYGDKCILINVNEHPNLIYEYKP